MQELFQSSIDITRRLNSTEEEQVDEDSDSLITPLKDPYKEAKVRMERNFNKRDSEIKKKQRRFFDHALNKIINGSEIMSKVCNHFEI